MPTKRDDAAYKAAYEVMRRMAHDHRDKALMSLIALRFTQMRPLSSAAMIASVDGCLDAETDALMERGLCASVLDWHKKPAGDELEW